MSATMTIDTLAQAMTEGFESMQRTMDSRFESMQKSMDDRFESMQGEVDILAQSLAQGFASMEERFTRVDIRLDSLEKEVRLTNEHIDRVVMPTIDSHARRIKDLELKLT